MKKKIALCISILFALATNAQLKQIMQGKEAKTPVPQSTNTSAKPVFNSNVMLKKGDISKAVLTTTSIQTMVNNTPAAFPPVINNTITGNPTLVKATMVLNIGAAGKITTNNFYINFGSSAYTNKYVCLIGDNGTFDDNKPYPAYSAQTFNLWTTTQTNNGFSYNSFFEPGPNLNPKVTAGILTIGTGNGGDLNAPDTFWQIYRVTLILDFGVGIKTIYWKNLKFSDNSQSIELQFNQNFAPIAPIYL